MSKVAIQGAATGTGVFTLASPSTNTDRTLTLPDVTATVITDSAGVLNIGSGQVYKDASGNVGIGTSSPALKLSVDGDLWQGNGAGTEIGRITNAAGWYDFGGSTNVNGAQMSHAATLRFLTASTERMRITSGGELLVGTTSNPYAAKLVSVGVGDNVSADFYRPGTGASSAIVTFVSNVGGTRALKSYIDTAGTLISTSDARLKENVQAFDAGLNCVLELNPVYFNWKGDASTQAGFIAQEVEQVLPIAVREMQSNGLEDMRTLDKNVLLPVLVKAIQELKAINDAQAQTIESLTARVVALEGQP